MSALFSSRTFLILFLFWTGLAAASVMLGALEPSARRHGAATALCALLFGGLATSHDTAFALRGAAYFVVFIGNWVLLERWPSRAICVGAFASTTVALALAVNDWLGSDTGLYFVSGAFATAVALLALVTIDRITADQLRALSMLLISSAVAWAFLAFPLHHRAPRTQLEALLIASRFVFPIGLLTLKMTRQRLATVSIWTLVAQLGDLFWLTGG